MCPGRKKRGGARWRREEEIRVSREQGGVELEIGRSRTGLREDMHHVNGGSVNFGEDRKGDDSSSNNSSEMWRNISSYVQEYSLCYD